MASRVSVMQFFGSFVARPRRANFNRVLSLVAHAFSATADHSICVLISTWLSCRQRLEAFYEIKSI